MNKTHVGYLCKQSFEVCTQWQFNNQYLVEQNIKKYVADLEVECKQR